MMHAMQQCILSHPSYCNSPHPARIRSGSGTAPLLAVPMHSTDTLLPVAARPGAFGSPRPSPGPRGHGRAGGPYTRLEEAEGRRPLGQVLAPQRLGQVVLVDVLGARRLPLGAEHDDAAGDALAEQRLGE